MSVCERARGALDCRPGDSGRCPRDWKIRLRNTWADRRLRGGALLRSIDRCENAGAEKGHEAEAEQMPRRDRRSLLLIVFGATALRHAARIGMQRHDNTPHTPNRSGAANRLETAFQPRQMGFSNTATLCPPSPSRPEAMVPLETSEALT